MTNRGTARPQQARNSPAIFEAAAGSLRLRVEADAVPGSTGPTLRVCAAGEAGREWLRFDAFEHGAHFHLDPEGRNEVIAAPAGVDAIGWTIEELGGNLGELIAKASDGRVQAAEPRALETALRGAEDAMRNPPVDLDALDMGKLRQRLSEKWSEYPDDVLPAWVAEMDFPLAHPIRRVLRQALDRNDLGYALSPRDTGLPQVFSERMEQRFAWRVDPARVEVLSDVVQGMYIALQAYSEPGQGVVVQTPIYPPFLGAVRDTGRSLIENRFVIDGAGFAIDFDALEGAIDSRTRVLLLCNPHNPTGRVFTRGELERLAEIAIERNLIVVTDEIHADLVYPGHTHVPFGSLSEEVAARTVTLTSATKAFNLPGLRCSIAHFGSAELQLRFNVALPRHARGGLGILGLYATIAAWRHSQPWLDGVLARLDENRQQVGRFLAERVPRAVCFQPEATYLAWIDFAAYRLPTSPGRHLLSRARLALSDGPSFGSGLEGFARLNFATSPGILREVLERIATTFDQL